MYVWYLSQSSISYLIEACNNFVLPIIMTSRNSSITRGIDREGCNNIIMFASVSETRQRFFIVLIYIHLVQLNCAWFFLKKKNANNEWWYYFTNYSISFPSFTVIVVIHKKSQPQPCRLDKMTFVSKQFVVNLCQRDNNNRITNLNL